MSLHSKGLIVSLSIGMPPQSKTLKGESEVLEHKHGTEPNQAVVVSKLFARQDIKGLQQAATQARNWFKEKTLSYGRGLGLIPAKQYFSFLQDMGAHRLSFNDAKKNLIEGMEDVLKRAQAANGSLFNRENYPSLTELENNIYFAIECHPVPASNDYDKLADLTPEELELLKKEAVVNSQTKMQTAIHDLFNRLLQSLVHAATKLQDDENGERKIFRDSLISNIFKAIEAAETLNLADDQQITDFTGQIKEIFDGITASDLRSNAKLRKETAEKAADLVQKMSELF